MSQNQDLAAEEEYLANLGSEDFDPLTVPTVKVKGRKKKKKIEEPDLAKSEGYSLRTDDKNFVLSEKARLIQLLAKEPGYLHMVSSVNKSTAMRALLRIVKAMKVTDDQLLEAFKAELEEQRDR